MAHYCIGIDTGGTCTDGVLLRTDSREIVRLTKVPTTHYDLSLCIGKALGELLQGCGPGDSVERIAVSSTLATNAVVEQRGARVGLVVIGHVKPFQLPVETTIFLHGGHTIMGEEEEPLDLDKLVDTLRELRGTVDSYAVCAAMSTENPNHELVAAHAISLLDPRPVFCSHEVSSHAGMRERAATAALHAKLMPLMQYFTDALGHAMQARGLDCPLLMVCGDGQGIALEESVRRAALTVASGPAATACFGATVESGEALVVDVGGTTTDVCMIRGGQPVMDALGCRIGSWQTHVQTVDMFTAAGGGDSLVALDAEGGVTLEQRRVQPLAMTPELPAPGQWLGRGSAGVLLMAVPDLTPEELAADEVLAFLNAEGPATESVLAVRTRMHGMTLEKHLERLSYQQRISATGFTPTDALHALGLLELGDSGQAVEGARVLAGLAGCSPEILCRRVVEATEQRIGAIILEYLARKVWGADRAGGFINHLDNPFFHCRVTLHLPLLGIGAAARFFLPGVANLLGTRVHFPDHGEVGNAVGAALIGLQGDKSR